ncbi:hypothetical protein NQ317_005947 [Molorchus minor]|uniref:Carboxylesterase type B domain-containing protein n=1 Tax=Molorchus minor TaxID=1323400 RepID=A0ABQ9IRW2_9CUCU|nr:hypothetical protein NQ317_005947 [Molorchus minor]
MYEAVANGRINKVPLLIGMNSEEEISLAGDLDNFAKTVRNYEKNIQLLADEDMYIDDESVRTTARGGNKGAIYTDGLLQDNLPAAVQLYLSISVTTGLGRAIIRYADLQSQYSDVYFYQFSYHGLLGGNNVSLEGIGRVAHAEDTKYLWSSQDGTDLSGYPAADVTTLDRYVALFTNFAKNLNQTPSESDLLQNLILPKVSSDKFYYLDIDENLEIKQNPREFSFTEVGRSIRNICKGNRLYLISYSNK